MTETATAARRVGPEDPAAFAATARDSLRVGVWTAVSRVTGFVRVVVVAAVLGPTFLGNTYQFTNSLPNLVYYGLLGGALVSSLLVPALVRQVGSGEVSAAGRIAGGFLGVALAASAVAIPVALVVIPRLLQATLSEGSPGVARAQLHAATWLLVLVMPQAACYAVVATSAAVMNAHGRFALAAAAPALENAGTLAVMAAAAFLYGTRQEVTGVPTGMLLLLGGGTTAAVALHALVQWGGARRAGTTVRPRAGWRDDEVRSVVRQGAIALLQAGLWSLQLLVLSTLANRVRGGVVAVQIAMNFFFLPVAVGAAPVAIALQPRLARLHQAGRDRDQADAFLRGVALTMFVTVPAAAAYLVLAPGLADLVALGRMSGHGGSALVAVSLRAVAVGLAGTAVFTVATYACYARGDIRRPVRLMAVQTVVALSVMGVSGLLHGTAALGVLGTGLSAASVLGAILLVRSLRASLPASSTRLRQFLPRLLVSTAAMAVAAWSVLHVAGLAWPGRRGSVLGTLAAVVLGGVVYVCVQRGLHAPEINWLRGRTSGADDAAVVAGAP
jgi:putative peptidoglycan lipid II flippase